MWFEITIVAIGIAILAVLPEILILTVVTIILAGESARLARC